MKSFACLAVLALACLTPDASRAGNPAPPVASKMPASVVVRPGTVVPKAPRPIEPTSFAVDLGKVEARSETWVELEIRNTSAAPVKILGGNSGCSRDGCVAIRGKYPVEIAPGATGKVTLQFHAMDYDDKASTHPAGFEANFYVGGTTTFAVPFRITGEVVPAPTPTTAPAVVAAKVGGGS